MTDLIIACKNAKTVKEVDRLVELNINDLEKYPVLRRLAVEAYRRIYRELSNEYISNEKRYLN